MNCVVMLPCGLVWRAAKGDYIMQAEKSITVRYLEQESAILMQWEHEISREDVRPAFQSICEILDASPIPIFVVVDISSNPQFPAIETVNGAMSGPARHPKLKGWLVIGKNTLAQVIGRTISSLTGSSNIHWFDDYDQMRSFLLQSYGLH